MPRRKKTTAEKTKPRSRASGIKKSTSASREKRTEPGCHTVSVKTYANWKPVSKQTKQFFSQMMDTNISEVLHSSRNQDFSEVQATLSGVKAKVLQILEKIRMPDAKVGIYGQLNSVMRKLELELADGNNQLEKMDQEVQKVEGLWEELTQEKAKLEKEVIALKTQDSESMQQIHPLLKSTVDLELPQLPSASLAHPKAKVVPLVNAVSQELLDELDEQQQHPLVVMQDFVQKVAAQVDSLPPAKLVANG